MDRSHVPGGEGMTPAVDRDPRAALMDWSLTGHGTRSVVKLYADTLVKVVRENDGRELRSWRFEDPGLGSGLMSPGGKA
jgi:hypothetical protein